MTAMFDSRVFNLSKDEVCNYFIWRQQDTTRNSVQMVGQANFSHKELQGVSVNKLQNKLLTERNINWNNIPTVQKRGTCIVKKNGEWVIDKEIPIFTQNRIYVEGRL